MPRRANYLDLDPAVKDDWGLPATRITYEMHADDMKTMQWLVERERAYLRQWLSWVDMRSSEADILDFIRGALGQFAANQGFSAGIWADGALAGVITLHKISWLDRTGEIGYWLAPLELARKKIDCLS